MAKASFTKDQSAPSLAARAWDELRADRSIRIDRPDTEKLEGKTRGAARAGPATGRPRSLSGLLDQRRKTRTNASFAAHIGDRRQQAIVKLHYFNRGAGGAGGMVSHVAYVSREGTDRDALDLAERHADYLTREGEHGRDRFYSADRDQLDGKPIAAYWARADKRHFRIVLTAEEGAALRDLHSYTREVMARAEAALGKPLVWIAIDHWDTDNPHTHIILRGRDRLGRDLILPKDFVRHAFRGIARDVATERLGERTAEQSREALNRETRRHAPTRLDRLIADQLPENGAMRVASLVAPNRDPALTKALKARAKELERLGLAKPIRRNVLAFTPDWQDRLKAMELHLDLAKRMAQARQLKAVERVLDLATRVGRGR